MKAETQHGRVVEWLSTPRAYPHRPARVEQIETHISRVFVAGELVYKLKKPVQFAFLDFSTPEKREQACREEVRLNRRLAPDVYLDVVPIVRAEHGGYEIDGTGEVVDWLVRMRRLATDHTLESLHQRGLLRPEHVERLAETLIAFYRSLAPLTMPPPAYRERCQAHVQDNRRELLSVRHHLPKGIVERIHGFQMQLLALVPELFEQRVVNGRIVEGHGDLRPEHICLGEETVIFDCIEFSRELRELDVTDELAFLAAECDFLGAGWVGTQLFEHYERQANDRPPMALIDFYKSYRACVRAKVAALRATQASGDEQSKAAEEAARHLQWADRYTQPWLRPLVIVVGGLPGTGKSTLAKALASVLGGEWLRTDRIRRELFESEGQKAAADTGIYRAELRERVYRELFQQAAALVSEKVAVVLDGTFSSAKQLSDARSLGSGARTIWLAVECCCPAEVARERISRRLEAGIDPSEARPEIHDLQRERWEDWPRDLPQVRLDTSSPLADQVAQVTALLRHHYLNLTDNTSGKV